MQFHSTTANKIDSEHIRDYKKFLPVCEVEILQVTVKQFEVFSSLRLISDDFRLKSVENSYKWYLGFLSMFIKTNKLSIDITIQS